MREGRRRDAFEGFAVMIEITVMHYLEAQLPDVPWYMEKPEKPPERYGLVRKTGSGMVNHIHETTVAVQSIAPSLYEAMLLNDRAVAALRAMSPADGVFTVRINSDYEYTDMTTKEHRYQAVAEVYH